VEAGYALSICYRQRACQIGGEKIVLLFRIVTLSFVGELHDKSKKMLTYENLNSN
jgi:hypothetical protein